MSKKRISVKTVFSRHLRGIRIWQKYDSQLLPSLLLSRLFSGVTPFAAVWLSARILNALAAHAEAAQVWRLVALTLGVTAALAGATAALNRWHEARMDGYWYINEKNLADKHADMDFADADSQRVADMAAQIRQNTNWSGWGLLRVLQITQRLIGAFATTLCGLALSLRLFLLPVPEGSLSFLGSPLFALLLLAFMAAAAFASGRLANYAENAWLSFAADARFGNRVFGAYGFCAADYRRSLDVRIYRQERISRHYMRHGNQFSDRSPFAAKYRGKLGMALAAPQGIGALVSGAIYLFVCLKAWAGAFPIGSATQYIGAVTGVFTGASALIVELAAMRANAAFLAENFEYLDLPNSMYQGSLTTEKRADRNYTVEFRGVSFKYPGSEAYALRDVNISFRVGSRLAVVGMNGSGKTTFIKLLCRLYDPTEGEILLNGIDIRKYRYDEYMDIFSIVFQDFSLFALPLGENVAASAQYDRARAEDCLQKAGFAERLADMPAGLDTYLYKELDKDGVEVSGGEAQKIAIARALYKDAPFIVLDEPTAALDPIAEAEIYSRFNEIAGDKTAIYISHRLSSCKFCDEIAVFDGGKIVQQGSHEELLADADGKYAELWMAQAQYYVK